MVLVTIRQTGVFQGGLNEITLALTDWEGLLVYQYRIELTFESDDDNFSVRNNDECLVGIHECDVNADCTVTSDLPGYTCKAGYIGDGRTCLTD